MRAETTSTPPSSVREPKVKRTSEEISATPMVASSSPKQPPMSPFSRLASDSAAISERPKIASQKYSTGPKASATSASGGASRSSRSEEHTSELQSLMRISYAVFCLKTKKIRNQQ